MRQGACCPFAHHQMRFDSGAVQHLEQPDAEDGSSSTCDTNYQPRWFCLMHKPIFADCGLRCKAGKQSADYADYTDKKEDRGRSSVCCSLRLSLLCLCNLRNLRMPLISFVISRNKKAER